MFRILRIPIPRIPHIRIRIRILTGDGINIRVGATQPTVYK